MFPVVDVSSFTNIASLSNLDFLLVFVGLIAIVSLYLFPGGLAWAIARPKSREAIPGPSGWPVIGLIDVFSGATPHRALSQLAHKLKAKSLMAFSLGVSRFVIASDPVTAKEILNSSAFADRPVKESAYELLFHRAMGFAPYGEYWRNLRRIAATHLFCPSRIDAFEPFRYDVGMKMVHDVNILMEKDGQLQIKNVLRHASLNNVMRTVFGKSYDFGVLSNGFELLELVNEGYELLGIFNWSDHFPLLRHLDLQGIRKRCRILVAKVNIFVDKIIDDHRMKRVSGKAIADLGDFVDVLLDLEKDQKLSSSDMIAVLWEMIFRGTDTVAVLLEWALARMVLHPEIQAKVQAEIHSVVGNTRSISDSDTRKMPYLQAVVKETLRIHPPGPLLSWARLAIHDINVDDKFIPAGTTAMVNMWSITHDEKVWSDPEAYNPERFIGNDVNIMGCDLRLAPFGSGRRVCPGKTLGVATIHLWLAQLLHTFNWLPAEEVDLTELLKLSMEMKKPLVCRAIPRSV